MVTQIISLLTWKYVDNAVEMLPVIYFTFTRYAGLYFWSMVASDLGVLIYSTGYGECPPSTTEAVSPWDTRREYGRRSMTDGLFCSNEQLPVNRQCKSGAIQASQPLKLSKSTEVRRAKLNISGKI